MPDRDAPIHRFPVNGNGSGKTKGPRLVIDLDDRGGVNVGGPIRNKVLAFGMLGAAYDAICEYHRKAADGRTPLIDPTVEPPPGDVT